MGPDEEEIETSETYVWARVCKNNVEECIEQYMITPNGYVITRDASITIAKKILAHEDLDPDYHTPAGLFTDKLLDELEDIKFV